MKLLPKPQEMKTEEGKFYLDYKSRIVLDSSCEENGLLYAKMLKEAVKESTGLELGIVRTGNKEGDILLGECKLQEREQYKLTVTTENVLLCGSNEELLLNGVQTLCQMLAQCGSVLPCVEIIDYPIVPTRGFYHDVTRGRVPSLEELKKLVDSMCYYKLNQLQLYVEHTYLFDGFSEMWRDETPLTAEEILELDEYCAQRHIDLVPSIATFGHLYKLLRTKEYEDCCELENGNVTPFSFWERMGHHTVNVSNSRSMETIKKMITEYMGLFRSKFFNICADETFDLCKGRSASLTQDRDVKEIYVDYVEELSHFLIERGKIPMFWGDILAGSPEFAQRLPKENICLNWGYVWNQSDDQIRSIASIGAQQYVCPGVCGWNEWINLFWNSYENIRRMCSYGQKYKAIGVLNTDWGDFGHINHPEFSRPGMIYGAALSWNSDEMSFEEINEAVSVLEYGDKDGKVMKALTKQPEKQSFSWWETVVYYESRKLGMHEEEEITRLLTTEATANWQTYVEELKNVRRMLQEAFVGVDAKHRPMLQKYMIGLDAKIIWNRVKPFVVYVEGKGEKPQQDACELARELETWFMHYKEEWRKVSREGDLRYISDIVFYYADLLREVR